MSRHKWGKMAENRIVRLMTGKWEKLQFFAILPYLCLFMGDPLTQPLLLLTKMSSLDTLAMIAMERKLLQATSTQFSCHLSENSILGQLSPFVPADGQPLDPIPAFIDKKVITRCCCSDSYKEKATPAYYHHIFPSFA